MSFEFPVSVYSKRVSEAGQEICWDSAGVQQVVADQSSLRTIERALCAFLPETLKLDDVRDEKGLALNQLVATGLDAEAKQKRLPSLILQFHETGNGRLWMVNDGRGGRKWCWIDDTPGIQNLTRFLDLVFASYDKPLLIWPTGAATAVARDLREQSGTIDINLPSGGIARLALTAYASQEARVKPEAQKRSPEKNMDMTHLDRLEAESIHIIREVMAEAEKPVMLYSIGKDSSVMLRLAEKAFYPGKPPFPLMHVDTRWKFQAMYEFRQRIADETGMELLVHINPEGVEKNINPFDHGSALHTDVMKTQGLIQALDKHGFDAAFGGARRDEEKSRAKERVFSFRNSAHRWDPKNQRPELWNLYNGRKAPGESIRVFPLSNWTELDIWQYIYREDIPIVPLYFAAERPVIERDGMLMLVDDDRLKLYPGEKIQTRRVRFRTLGCYPLTGAIESDADTLPKILLELLEARTSERQGRAIDTDSAGSMEKKKQEGYF